MRREIVPGKTLGIMSRHKHRRERSDPRVAAFDGISAKWLPGAYQALTKRGGLHLAKFHASMSKCLDVLDTRRSVYSWWDLGDRKSTLKAHRLWVKSEVGPYARLRS